MRSRARGVWRTRLVHERHWFRPRPAASLAAVAPLPQAAGTVSLPQPSPLPSAPHLLVVVDPAARSQPALAKAAHLARALHGSLAIYACDFDFDEGLAGRGRAAARRAGLEAGRRPQVCYELGHRRAPAILARIRRSHPDLVLVDSHFHAGAGRALFGPADWPLIRDCAAPLRYAKPAPSHAVPRIAAAVDPRHPAAAASGLDARLVATARQLARRLGGSLRVIHAWLPSAGAATGPAAVGLPSARPAAVEAMLGRVEAEARATVAALARAGGRPAAEVVLLRGAAVEALPDYAAAEGLDMVVLGAVSRGRRREALVGATAERLLERVACDLLVVNARYRGRAPAARRRGSASMRVQSRQAAGHRPGAVHR